ncbi:MAG: hypothetical protein IPG96_20345 [Proteobacteria bacterium]|nr:hypothetical protein [Pseudomonadota bacterium]
MSAGRPSCATIDWILALPWGQKTAEQLDIERAEPPRRGPLRHAQGRERILEHLAVQSLVKQLKGPILCFVSPPGVGKTSSAAASRGRRAVTSSGSRSAGCV